MVPFGAFVMKKSLLFISFILSLAAIHEIGFAKSTATNMSVNVTILARAKLTLNPSTINFPSASPDTTPNIPADNSVNIVVSSRSTATATLDVLALQDLTSGSFTIPIGNVTWTASGQGFQAGTMNRTTSQRVGTFSSSGSYIGMLSFAFANSWNYFPGSYSAIATFTLTAP
jgi:hypothetical protein